MWYELPDSNRQAFVLVRETHPITKYRRAMVAIPFIMPFLLLTSSKGAEPSFRARIYILVVGGTVAVVVRDACWTTRRDRPCQSLSLRGAGGGT